MVRANPLPPGRYWIFIGKASLDIFELWLKKNADVVTVEKKETYGDVWPIIKPDEAFYIFAVKEKTIWPRGVGFPNTADPTITSPADVKTRGPVPTVKDVVKDIAQTAAEAASSATGSLVTIAVIAGLVWAYTQGRK